ncbi:MAG TPA: protein kinase [Ktedonobacterales bacterium]|nr:protein kinase [Ktedonobacterales bacterium]
MRQQASQMALPPGAVLARRYRVDELIGSGGYANVYRATDMKLGYERAIKEVADGDKGVREQFRLEAELLINSKHPNIPAGYHVLEENSRLYVVMDYVRGPDLEELLNQSLTKRQRPLDEAEVLRWAIDISGALEEMHNLSMPVIHRDIKPANIKIAPGGQPILIDFGLAKLHAKNNPTQTAAQGVSPGFAPPEQYMAKGRTDARTDVYGLGATLYACLTGKDPPEAPGRLLAQAGAGSTQGMQLVAPRKLNPRISEATERLVMKALELSPGARQQTARQIRDELTAAYKRLTGAAEQTLTMGAVVCGQCGARNHPESLRCSKCGAPLGLGGTAVRPAAPPADAFGTGKRGAVSPDASGKRAAVPAGMRSSAKVAVPPAGRAAEPAEQRSGRQVAVAPTSTAKRTVVSADDRKTGKQAAAARRSSGPGAVPALSGTAAVAALPAKPGRAAGAALATKAKAKPAARGASDARDTKAWIRLGSVPVSGFGKFMLAAAGIEALWGALVVTLTGVELVYGASPPVPQLVIGWLVLIGLTSVVGGQALTRPVYRRDKMARGRRWLQGAVLIVYSLAVQGAGVWAVYVFRTQQASPTLALAAYVLFGICSLLGGMLGISTVLG